MPFLRFMPILLGVCLIGALSDVSIADAPEWEKRFRAVQKIQDGEIQGLLEKKQPLDSLIGRYTSRFQMERTALNAGLVGRLLVFQGLQMQQPQQRDAKFATALKYFAEAIRLQPSFWFARLGSTQIYLFRNDIDRADRALAPAVRQKPNEPGVMEMQVQVLLLRERYAPALELLRRLLRLDPKAYKFHAMEAEILWYQARWAESAAKFEWLIRLPSETPLLRMNEMEWRRRAGLCYMQLEDHSRAERHLGRVVRAFPDKLSVRAALELCYLKLNKPRALLQQVDWLMGYFQREIQKAQSTGSTGQDAGRAKMLGEQLEIYRRKRAEVQKWVAANSIPMEARNPPAPTGNGAEAQSEENVLTILLRTILTGSTAERRQALRDWQQRRIPGVPGVLVARFHPSETPDAESRLLIGRIISKVDKPELAPYLAFGIFDQDPRVRRLVVETLGKRRWRGSLLYLVEALQQFSGVPQGGSQFARSQAEDEFNAIRYALYRATGYKDIEDPDTARVPWNRVDAMRHKWITYFDSDVGAAQLAEALGNFLELDPHDPMPYVLPLTQHREPFVVRAAYMMISAYRDLVMKESKNERARQAFSRFPSMPLPAGGATEGWAETTRVALKKWVQQSYKPFRVGQR